MVEKSEVVEAERGWSTEEGGMLSLNVFLSSPSVLAHSERLVLTWRLPAQLRCVGIGLCVQSLAYRV